MFVSSSAVLKSCARVGAATMVLGFSLAFPHCDAVAIADTGDGAVSTRSEVSALPGRHPQSDRKATRARIAAPATSRTAPARSDSSLAPARRAVPNAETPSGSAPTSKRLRVNVPIDPAPASLRAASAAAVPVQHTAAVVAHQLAPAQSIGAALSTALTDIANWLSTFPPNPLTGVLEGAVYLVRRTLFPATVGVVTAPIQVPLYLTPVGDSQKLGIYATIGSGAVPQIFELDTGGPGLYAAYASEQKSASLWWGSGVNKTDQTVNVRYDSGNAYEGFAATGQVSLFAEDGTTPLLTTGRATVGQMYLITNGDTPLWTPTGAPGDVPPINGAFWGDFGLAPTYKTNGITSLLSQLSYARGVLPGYRIHIDQGANEAWLQIGLTKQDVADPTGRYFPMNIDPNAPGYASNPNSRLRYYSEQAFQATITVTDPAQNDYTVVNTPNVGMTPDTGSQTVLHWPDRSPIPAPTQWAQISQGGPLNSNLDFIVTGTTTSGAQGGVMNFTTTTTQNQGRVAVQNSGNPLYYLNTGIKLFFDNDVVYYLGNSQGGGTFGLIANGT